MAGREWCRGQREAGGGLADEQGDGVLRLGARHAHIDGLGLRGFELGLGLHHIGLGGHAAGVLVIRQLERLLVVRDGLVQELLLGIVGAQLKVVLRQRSLIAQAGALQIARARLGAGLVGLDRAADRAPEVQLPREVEP